MGERLRNVARVAMVAALALLLTGCLKLDMDLQIRSDDTVDGSVVFAINKDVLELTGGSAEDLLGGETPFPSDVEGVTTEEYDDGEFAGQRFGFDGVPIGVFVSDPNDPEALSIVRDGDTFEVSGVFDLSQGATGATGPVDAQQFFESAEIRIAITFPGEVIESNGEVDGNTVSWAPKFGERVEIQATGSAIEGAGSSSNTLLYVLIALGIVAVIAIAVVVVMMSRRKGPEAGAAAPGEVAPPADTAATVPTAVAPPAAPEPVAPTAPEPSPAAPTAPEPSAEPESGGGEPEVPPPPPPPPGPS